jgi:carbon storage regulator
MLILRRKTDEAILIGDDIRITVIETSGSNVRIGIVAPKELKVLRAEMLEKPKEERHERDAA